MASPEPVDMQDLLPPSVTAICPRLYAVGAAVSLERRRPIWMPESARGWLPMACYVFRDADSFILVDSGTGAIRQDVLAGVRALVSGAKIRHAIMTRIEPDCALNLRHIIAEFGIPTVDCALDLNPLELYEFIDEANAEALVKVNVAQLAVHRLVRAGDLVEIGSFKFEILRPPMRVLSSSWVYERTTKTLLTSDSWGFLTSDRPTAPRAVGSQGDMSVERIREFIGTKFDCYRGVDTAVIANAVVELMGSHQVERICPSYGFVIEGAAAVRKVVDNTVTALAELGRMPRRSVMTGFRFVDRNETATG